MVTYSKTGSKLDGGPASTLQEKRPEIAASIWSAKSSRVKILAMFLSLSQSARWGGMLAACAFLSLGGCQTSDTGNFPKQRPEQRPGALAPGDVIKLAFPGAPELNQTQKIRADGRVNLPLIGEVTAAGKRLGTFQQELTSRYASKLQNKEVIVVLESSAIPIYVSGAVGRPGKIVLDRPMTVLEGIMEAGGFTQIADPKKVKLVRIENGQHRSYVLNLEPALKGRPSEALYLSAYDVIYVPESLF